jgi:hypothetical protein
MKWPMTFILVGLILWVANVSGQQEDQPREGLRERRMKLREELHRKMFNQLFYDRMADDLFKDLDQVMNDSLKEMESMSFSFNGIGSNQVETKWDESSTGRTLIVTPKDPKNPLDIKVQDGFITIKGKSSVNGQFQSEFSYSVNVHPDVAEKKLKMSAKDNKIFLFFPYLEETKTIKKMNPSKENNPDQRIPLKPDGSGVEI